MEVVTAAEAFDFMEFRLDRSGGGLFRADGSSVPIGSRALDILQLLVEASGELVSKDRIRDVVWQGLAVEESNLTVQISALRKALDNGRVGASCIQTVSGRGYRLVCAVARVESATRVPAAEANASLKPSIVTPEPRSRPDVRRVMACLAVLAAALIAITLLLGGRRSQDAPPRLSVAVLPFDNLGGDSRNEALARAVTEDLATDLADEHNAPPLVIVASPRPERGEPGKAFARYALSGSLNTRGGSLQVNAQLHSTETDALLWTERLEEDATDAGAAASDLAQQLGQIVKGVIVGSESARSRKERPTDPDVLDLLIRARALKLHPMGNREHRERIELFEQALHLDPHSLMTLAQLAEELTRDTARGLGDGLARANQALDQARAIDPDNILVLDTTGFLAMAQGRYEQAVAAYQTVLDEHPKAYFALVQIGECLIYLGRAQDAIPLLEKAIRLEPRSSYAWGRYFDLALAATMLARNEDAVAWGLRALATVPQDHLGARYEINTLLAASYARLGRLDDAHRAVAEASRARPYATVRGRSPENLDSPIYAAQIEAFQVALRLAGLRDHAEEDADFGVPSDGRLRSDLAGPTPLTVPGAATIGTAELQRLLTQRPVILDSMLNFWGRSIPGAVGLKQAGFSSDLTDAMQARLGRKLHELTKGDLSAPVVAVGWNSERFDGSNLALRLAALGYRRVFWYRGGRESWEVNGLPETTTAVQDW